MRAILPLLFCAACGGKVADTWAVPPDPDVTPGVYCGAADCAAGEACLLRPSGPRACVKAADAPCDGCIFASCDGPEDCAPGTSCLEGPHGDLTCARPGSDVCVFDAPRIACHTRSDCPACFEACAGSGASVPGASDVLEYGTCAHAP